MRGSWETGLGARHRHLVNLQCVWRRGYLLYYYFKQKQERKHLKPVSTPVPKNLVSVSVKKYETHNWVIYYNYLLAFYGYSSKLLSTQYLKKPKPNPKISYIAPFYSLIFKFFLLSLTKDFT